MRRKANPDIAFLNGGGESGALIRTLDWATSPLGDPAHWPQTLKTLVAVMLGSNQPMFIIWGPERTLLYNDGCAPMLGRRHPQALGKPFAEARHDAMDTLGPSIDRAYAGEAAYVDDIAFVRDRDGDPVEAHFALSFTPARDASGMVAGLFCTCTEITRQVLAERRLTVEHDQLRQMFEQVPGIIAMLEGPEHRFVLANAAFRQPIPGREIIGKPFRDVMPELVEQGILSLLDRVYSTGEPFRGEAIPFRFVRDRDQPAEERIADIVYQPITDAAGKVTGIFMEGVEVTERVRTEARLRESEVRLRRLNEELQERVAAAVGEREDALQQLHEAQKLETLGQLTGGVAHDFNNLLTPIVGSLDLLRRRLPEDPKIERLIDGALQAADRARTLVSRLLAFGRRQVLQPRPTDVDTLLQGMTDLIQRTIGHHISVIMEPAADLPAARVDPNQLELAILNLAINARDAMPGGGTLTITAQPAMLARGNEPGLAAGQYIRLSVIDTGTGMDAATLKRAIEPFFTTKGVGKGTGLGLSMIHGLAGQLGGALTLSSTPGVGTHVDLWLPVAEVTEVTAPSPSLHPAPMRRSEGAATILLVDDEELARMSVSAMLADLGYSVVEAGSGAKALQLLEDSVEADAIVTDYLMPGMNGGEFIEEARKLRPGLPALIVTGYATVTGIGADIPLLTKPFRHEELAEKVSALLEHARGDSQFPPTTAAAC